MDGVNSVGQSFLQGMQYVVACALHWGVVEKLLKCLHFNQHNQVLQEVALNVGQEFWCLQELMRKQHNQEKPTYEEIIYT